MKSEYIIERLWTDSGHFDVHKHANKIPLITEIPASTVREILEQRYKF